MHIYAINSIKNSPKIGKINNNQPYHIGSIALKEEDKPQSSDARAIYAYRDYSANINFTGRNPEDFYKQDFAQLMPDTMKKYIAQNPEVTRSHGINNAVPPTQIMYESFINLKKAVRVADVKREFPNEPLFAELKEPNYNVNHGIFNKIGIVRNLLEESNVPEANRTLFKNGLDNPVIYVLRKKYIECKTDNEIQKDIARDINPYFELAAKEDGVYFPYSSLHNLGVKNPNLPFWNALINTRADYAHAYRTRVQVEGGKFVDREVARRRYGVTDEPKEVYNPNKNKYTPNETVTREIGDIVSSSDTLNANDIVKSIKRGRKSKNTQELTFVQKYWSEIMSIATEKVHLSEEMIKFNENIEKLKIPNVEKFDTNILDEFVNGTQNSNLSKTKAHSLSSTMHTFWKENPLLRQHFSLAISDTIRELTIAYGADGNNSEFKIMCDYAHSLKPKREQAKAIYSAQQAEYEKLSRVVPEIIQERLVFEKPQITSQGDILPVIAEDYSDGHLRIYPSSYKPKGSYYTTFINGNRIRLPHEPYIDTIKFLKMQSPLLPDKYIKARLDDIKKLLGADFDKFCISVKLNKLKADHSIKNLLYTTEEINEIFSETADIDLEKRGCIYERIKVALMDWAFKHNFLQPEDAKMATKSHTEVRETIFNYMADKGMTVGDAINVTNLIDKKAIEYSKPLTSSEINRICIEAMDFMRNNFDRRILESNADLDFLFNICNRIIKSDKEGSRDLKSIIIKTLTRSDFMQKDDFAVRYLLEPNAVTELKNSLMEILFREVFKNKNEKELTNFLLKYKKYVIR